MISLAEESKFGVLVVTLLCINILLTISGSLDVHADGNLITNFYKVNGSNIQGMDNNFTDATAALPSSGSVSGTAFEGFTDMPSSLSTLFKYFTGALTAPFQLWLNSSLGLPWVFQWLVGMPLSLMWVLSIIAWWRGLQ